MIEIKIFFDDPFSQLAGFHVIKKEDTISLEKIFTLIGSIYAHEKIQNSYFIGISQTYIYFQFLGAYEEIIKKIIINAIIEEEIYFISYNQAKKEFEKINLAIEMKEKIQFIFKDFFAYLQNPQLFMKEMQKKNLII